MMNLIEDQLTSINSNRQINSIFIFLQQRTGFTRDQLTYYIFGIFVVYLVFGWKSDFFCNLIVFLIPVYLSSHVVYELAGVNDTKWVLYWIVYTLFNFLEYFLYDSVKKFGLYWLAKFVFLIWFMIPGPIGGTNLLYNKIIRRSLIYFRFIEENDIVVSDEDEQDETKKFYDAFPNIDDVINETDPNIKKAKEFTQSILSKPPSGDVNDANTLWHIFNKLLGKNNQQCLFYDSEHGIKLHDASANLSDVNSEGKPFILTLSSSEGLGNIKRVHNKRDELRLIQLLNYNIKQKQSHSVLEDIIQRLSQAYGVSKQSIIIKYVYVGSFNVVYTVMDLSIEKIQELVETSDKLKRQFRRFIKLKIHPLLYRPAFDISQFDKLGNNVFANQNQTFPIGPPGRTKVYTQAAGWTRYGLKVIGRYKDDSWLHPFQGPNNWYRAFHGTGNATNADFGGKKLPSDANFACVDALANIYESGFRPARVDAFGPGVYCSPNPKFPENGYVRSVPLDTQNGKKNFKCMLQVAVNPDGVTFHYNNEIWVVADPKDIRPYGILIKEA